MSEWHDLKLKINCAVHVEMITNRALNYTLGNEEREMEMERAQETFNVERCSRANIA